MSSLLTELVSVDLTQVKMRILPFKKPDELVVGHLSETLRRVWWTLQMTVDKQVAHEAKVSNTRTAMEEVDWVLEGAELERRELVLRQLLRSGVKLDHPHITEGRYEIRYCGSVVSMEEGSQVNPVADIGYIGVMIRERRYSQLRK